MLARILAFAVAALVARPALPCSAFLVDGPDGPLVGKGYDWHDERGVLLVNPRGAGKRALVVSPADAPATWTSRFASLTFNQYGRELPNGGMNAAGLVVEVLMLPGSRFPVRDARPAVTELGLVQYLLDLAETTPEAVALAAKVRVASAYADVHYFVCDAAGACAALEFLGGRLVATSGPGMPVRALTNSTYAEASRAAATVPAARGGGSLARFARLAGRIRTPVAAGDAVAGAFAILDAVRFPDSTQWNVVYEQRSRRVHFRTRSRWTVKTVALDAFPPGCAQPAPMLDLLRDGGGDVAGAFVPYTEEANRALVRGTLAPMRRELPAGTVERVATHPRTLACVGE